MPVPHSRDSRCGVGVGAVGTPASPKAVLTVLMEANVSVLKRFRAQSTPFHLDSFQGNRGHGLGQNGPSRSHCLSQIYPTSAVKPGLEGRG